MPLCEAGISSNNGLRDSAMSCQSHSMPSTAGGTNPFRVTITSPVHPGNELPYYQFDRSPGNLVKGPLCLGVLVVSAVYPYSPPRHKDTKDSAPGYRGIRGPLIWA